MCMVVKLAKAFLFACCETWTGFVKHGFEIVKHGFVKCGFLIVRNENS